MYSIRSTSKTTIALIILAICIALLMYWCSAVPSIFSYYVLSLILSKEHFGKFHSFLVSASFWLLLLASANEAVFGEKRGFRVIKSFDIPIFISAWVAIWGFIAMNTQVNITWFWLCYYLCLLVGLTLSLRRQSRIKGAGPARSSVSTPRILLALSPPSRNGFDVSIIDRIVLYGFKMAMLVDWLTLFVYLIVFFVQNRLSI